MTTTATELPDVTADERLSWQIEGMKFAAELARSGHAAGLVDLVWTIGHCGQVSGTVYEFDADPYATFTAWVAHFSGSEPRSYRYDGKVQLRSFARNALGRPYEDVLLAADIDPADMPGGAA